MNGSNSKVKPVNQDEDLNWDSYLQVNNSDVADDRNTAQKHDDKSQKFQQQISEQKSQNGINLNPIDLNFPCEN